MTRLSCPMCGLEYSAGGAACHAAGCPLAIGGCSTHHCPRCGHTLPDEQRSLLARWVRRLFNRGAVPTGTLASLDSGRLAVVDAITSDGAVVADLAAQGVVPGARLTLVQRAPAYVIEIGETTLALERCVAETIRVRPEDFGLSV